MSAARDHRDPGAQPERTRLAWRRTTLTFTLVMVLAVRALVETGGAAGAAAVVAAALGALLWVAFLVLAHRRIRALPAARPAVAGRGTVLGSAAAVMGTAALAAVMLAAMA
jgi:hypothetical protein